MTVFGNVGGEGVATMNVTLNLNPEVEKARAHERGVSLDDYLQELVAREAGVPAAVEEVRFHNQADNLSDLLLNSPFAGANLDLERFKDYSHTVELG
jgi:hypothetical protein